MASLDEVISKIPRPLLVTVVLLLGIAFIVSQNPMQDGCGVEVKNFTRQVKGVLVGFKNKSGKIQPAQIEQFRDACRQGNSMGACENYYEALKKITDASRWIQPQCDYKLIEEYPNLVKVLSNGIQIMALNAWGDKPPGGVSERLGWVGLAHIYTFCRMKSQLERMTSKEDFRALRVKTYMEFPDAWPDSIPVEKRFELPRPKAFKSPENPKGPLIEDEVYKRSLFSIRCDLYY